MSKIFRRLFLKKIGGGLLSFLFFDYFKFFERTRKQSKAEPVTKAFFTTGFKISEVTPNAAIIWTRLCGQEKPNPIVHKRLEKVFRHPIDFDENQSVENMDGGVKGLDGFVRVKIFSKNDERISEWFKADAEDDYTVQIPFDNLIQGEHYQVEIEGKSNLSQEESNFARGSFKTAPNPEVEAAVNLVTSTCQYFWSYDEDKRGFRSYDSMNKLNPDFFVHTGDYIYYDKPGPLAKTIEQARHKWHAMDSWQSLVNFYENTPVYMEKDDHDLLKDDAYPTSDPYGKLTFHDGLKIWNENTAIRDKPYRTFQWGKDLQIWLVEGREYRSPNPIKDGPQKTIWGSTQKQWFKETVEASDASFKILFSPTPVVGPDRDKKADNHANQAFASEGQWLRNFLSDQKNMFVVNGDRHWQYVSVDNESGLLEFGSGPVSDAHAQGWNQDDLRPEHRFLRVKGGFMGIKVFREDHVPVIIFTHYDTEGNTVNEQQRIRV